MKLIRKKNHKEENNVRLDEGLVEFIQPRGGITFKEPHYITAGDGYVKVIHIYQLPSLLNDFWLDKICNIDGSIATIDIATKDTAEVKKNINKALKEEFSRGMYASDFMEAYNAKKRQEQLSHMYNELQSLGEVVKMVHFRIFLSGRNLYELEEHTEKIMKNFE